MDGLTEQEATEGSPVANADKPSAVPDAPAVLPLRTVSYLLPVLLLFDFIWSWRFLLWAGERLADKIPGTVQGVANAGGFRGIATAKQQVLEVLSPQLAWLIVAAAVVLLHFWVIWVWLGAGCLYLYPDRLVWTMGRWSNCIYFSGAERVQRSGGDVVVLGEGTWIRIPSHAALHPNYLRFHALLCERSAAFRAEMDLKLPLELKMHGRIAGALTVGGLIEAVVIVVLVLLALAWSVAETPLLTAFCVLAAAALILTAIHICKPKYWRLEHDALVVGRGKRRRRYSLALLESVHCTSELVVRFQDGTRISVGQDVVDLPLPLVAYAIRYLLERQKRANDT